MKKGLKIFLVVLLILVLGLEVYLYFFKEKNTEDSSIGNKTSTKKEKIDTKYLANLYSGYNSDNLTYINVKESDQLFYNTISGLKDKKIEDKVNQKIKDKINELKSQITSENALTNTVVSNFENTISISFCFVNKSSSSETGYSSCNDWDGYADSLNIDLTTGNELSILDIVNTKDSIKQQLLKVAHEDFSKKVGIACEGGPCEIDNPDYSMVEDEQFSIASKFNKDEYYFIFNPKQIEIIFRDTKIKNIQTCWENTTGCYETKVSGSDMLVKDNYETNYIAKIQLLDLLDNLIIYDKFKTTNNIYDKDSDKLERKFTLKKTNDDSYESEFIENDKYLVDYALIDIFAKKFPSKVKDSLLKEMITNNDKFTIYNVFGKIQTIGNYNYLSNFGSQYDYVFYKVYQYELDKNIFEQNKKQIYIDKYSKVDTTEGPNYLYDSDYKNYQTYSYLKDYMSKTKYFYYIYDKDGNRIDTSNILNKDYLSTVIPSDWYSIGKYNNINDMVKNALIIISEDRSYPNNLVIFIDTNIIKLKYKGKEIALSSNYTEYSKIVTSLYK